MFLPLKFPGPLGEVKACLCIVLNAFSLSSFLLLAVVLVCGWFIMFDTLYQLTLNKCLLMMVMLLEHMGTTVWQWLGSSTFSMVVYCLIPLHLIKINNPEVTQEFIFSLDEYHSWPLKMSLGFFSPSSIKFLQNEVLNSRPFTLSHWILVLTE